MAETFCLPLHWRGRDRVVGRNPGSRFMSVTGTRRVFTPTSFNSFSEIVLHGRRVKLEDLDSPYCLLECNNVGKMRKQRRGYLAMTFFQGQWRLCFVWKLTNDSLEFFLWTGPCTLEDRVPSVLFLDKDQIQEKWGEHLSFQKFKEDSTGHNLIWINYIAPSYPHRLPRFTSPPFTSVNPTDKCMQMSVAGPCAIWLPQPHLYRLILARNLEPEKRKRTKSRGQRRGLVPRGDLWHLPGKRDRVYSVLFTRRRLDIIQNVPPDEAGTVLVPFIETPCDTTIPHVRSFGVVRKREVLKLPQASASDFNKRLEEIQQRKVSLLTLPEPKSTSPLRIVSVDDAEFSLLHFNKASLSLEFYELNGTKYLYGTTTLSAVDLMGTMVACWDVYEEEKKQRVPFDFLCQMYATVGDGYADRSCAERVGTNVYFGARYSSRPRPSPNSGTGPNIYESRYYRESYQLAQVQAIIEACVEGLGRNIVTMAKTMNTNIFNFLGPDVCSKNIWTQGYPSKKVGKRHKKGLAVLAFANDPHVDKCDLLSDDIQVEWMREVTAMLLKPLSKPEESGCPFAHKVCKKLVELKNTFGLGLPTTCGYAYCHENKEDVGSDSVQQYFAYDGLGISVPIVDGSVHHFYGWAFVHRTSLCLRIFKDIVYYSNSRERKDFILAAWGRSGGSSEAKRNAGTRKRRR